MPTLAAKSDKMNRIFHARIAGGQYLFLILAGALAFYNLWEKQIILAIIFMLLLASQIITLLVTFFSTEKQSKIVKTFSGIENVCFVYGAEKTIAPNKVSGCFLEKKANV